MTGILRKLKLYFLHNMKLKYKFMITNLLLVLVPTLVIFITLYGRLSRIIEVNAIESEQAIVNQTVSTLEATVSQITYVMDTITSSPFLSQATYTAQMQEYLSDPKQAEELREFYSKVNSLVDHEFITAVKIYLPKEVEWSANRDRTGVLEPVDSVEGSYWHGIFAGSPQRVSLLCPSFYLTSSEIETLGSMAYIKKFTNIMNQDGSCIYIAVYFSEEHLTDILQQNLTSMESVYYIINSRDCIVSASSNGLAGTYFMSYDTLPEVIEDTREFTVGRILNEDLYMGYQGIHQTDWRLVSVIPADSVLKESHQAVYHTFFLYILFAVLACALALLLSRNMASRISRIVQKMNEYRSQMPVRLENNKDRDEIGQMVDNYNIMVDRIHDLMKEQTETAEKLKVSEVKALQAQINPHFLYNMMDMINWLAQNGQPEKVSIAVQTLSKFYKLTLSKKNITTTIREELNHVSLYVKLQNMRFDDKINFIIDVPDEILDYEIVKLVLQPIVENSIQHGIFEKESKAGDVVITAWMEAGDIIFVISDNGVGIAPQKLAVILEGNGQEGQTSSNIGIYNTHLRLCYLYGEGYGLHFESTLGSGTEVQLRIPAKECGE